MLSSGERTRPPDDTCLLPAPVEMWHAPVPAEGPTIIKHKKKREEICLDGTHHIQNVNESNCTKEPAVMDIKNAHSIKHKNTFGQLLPKIIENYLVIFEDTVTSTSVYSPFTDYETISSFTM